MPDDFALLNQWQVPIAIEVGGKVYSAGMYQRVTTASLLAYGNLVTVAANGAATLADQSAGTTADHVIIRVEDANNAWAAVKADMDLTLSGFPQTGKVLLFTGESGGYSQTPGSVLNQQVGGAKDYDGTTGKHRCWIDLIPQPWGFS